MIELAKRASRKALPAFSPVSAQYGALPYRLTQSAGLEILLITTKRSRRWIIPKGEPIKGLKPPKAAAQEAFEEAGVRGAVADKTIGSFRFQKTLDGAPNRLCEVTVYPLNVKQQMLDWPEASQRDVRWFGPDEAQAAVKDQGLRLLIARFIEKISSKSDQRRKALAAPELTTPPG